MLLCRASLVVACSIVVLAGGSLSTADGQPIKPLRVIEFGGRRWEVKNGQRLGPGPNDFSNSDDHVWTDKQGRLHLVIRQTAGRWQCAEVVATESLGYGEYRWVVSGNFPALDARVVLGLFLYENDRREIDFELSRWGDVENDNAQFVVQPYTKASMHRFDTGRANVLTCSLIWEKRLVRGRCWVGVDATVDPLAEWEYEGRKIPPHNQERARINLWLLNGKAPRSGTTQEVVVHSFNFYPGPSTRNPGERP